MTECDDCGAWHHFYHWECPYNLHGEEDSFKTSCAVCEERIPPNAPREGDKFGNLYCSQECAIEGRDVLLDISMENQKEVADLAA